MLSCISVSASRRLFLSTPLLHIEVFLCFPLRDRHGTSMSHHEHLGCGRFPSSNMITMSRTCRRQKCTLIAVRVPAFPGQPSTGHSLAPPLVGNSIRWVCGSPPPPVAALVQLRLSSFAFPCCIIRWASRDPSAISFPQSPHSTRSFFLLRYVGPSPVILRPYTYNGTYARSEERMCH